ncbi:Nucleoside-diphosphate-sugar epimerase [Andreprevotia lacus DSM 23236]|jgi:uncharacterized protein YbjT (DUF2867 family)|uniref:Nucleoside-diphosphate-sugar epimerase n=1 Tax=Andreprevotia lacus DSM 23236 TaxID=1121001 RepID=A0A1W1XI57_9NEIS|nr:NAD(P)H-binding protein [Andreprevotia lacus]SMC23686.1 Nucleoside-diphosphate-sugar epimerase [Andreprevotia lacus DSM 23236]
MRVLLLGADGFIGRHIKAALLQQGDQVIEGVRCANKPGQIAVDFQRDLDSASWLPRLQGIDAVVNCVGLFRERKPGDFETVQVIAPQALYAACRQAGVQRVLLISALGAAPDAPSAYWRSKAAGEAMLQSSGLDWHIVRPGLVYGADGASSQLFLQLASLPLLPLPAADTLLQPIHIDDLAHGCATLLHQPGSRIVAATGPRVLTLADYLRELSPRQRLCRLPFPDWLANLSAQMCNALPGSLLTRDSLAMLRIGSHADNTDFAALLPAPMQTPGAFVTQTQRLQQRLGGARLMLRLGLASVWLGTAVVSLWVYPAAASEQLLAACHVPAGLQAPARIASSLLDAGFGLLTLWRPGRLLWQAQLLLTAAYTVLVALFLPDFLAHPFGPLLKNAVLVAAMLALLHTEDD